MNTETFKLWGSGMDDGDENPNINAYIPDNKTSDAAIVIFAGGGYSHRAKHEGEGYATFFAKNGICSFVIDYRVAPYRFPAELLDARRAVRVIRHLASKYGINKDKIAVMGSSAGGHLAALCSTYKKELDCQIEKDEIDNEDFLPNAQILCYPVIDLTSPIGHEGSGKNLLGEENYTKEMTDALCPSLIAEPDTPQAFIWHTFEDRAVNVINSLDYAKRLKEVGVKAEVHIYPDGKHGLGLADQEDTAIHKHVSQWSNSLLAWLKYIGF